MLVVEIADVTIKWVPSEPDLKPDWLMTTPQAHYGENGSAWSHVSEADRQRVIAQYGSIWDACVEYARQDLERLEAWERGHWWFVGCCVTVKLEVLLRGHKIAGREFRASLWGIESDSDVAYMGMIEEDLLVEIAHAMSKAGFNGDALWEAAGRQKPVPPVATVQQPALPPARPEQLRRFVEDEDDPVPGYEETYGTKTEALLAGVL